MLRDENMPSVSGVGMNIKQVGAIFYLFILSIMLQCYGCNGQSSVSVPAGVDFKLETVKRIGGSGDNWCLTWAKDGSQITSMDDGNWLNEPNSFHNNIYRIIGGKDDFVIEDIPGYPKFTAKGEGWFGYGIYSVNGTIYSMVSKTQNHEWSYGPFRGFKMLKSTDNGKSWYRVSRNGDRRLVEPMDENAKEEINHKEMFFLEEFGLAGYGQIAYPFSYCSFVEHGQDNAAAKDEYIYIYSPEGAQAHRLLLARVKAEGIETRDNWEYFSGWSGKTPVWSKDISRRDAVYIFPDKNKNNEYFGWYSWLPSVVWNPGLKLYIMVNGGTYAGRQLSNSAKDYYNQWMHTKTGSLGFWYSENPYGPWTQFYYTDYWTADNENNLTYQPKLSSKWISDNGKSMVLIWSDAMKNEEGKAHTINYRWNQMEIIIKMKD